MTTRALEVLRIMRDKNLELAYEKGIAYVGYERIIGARSILTELNLAMALHLESGSKIGEFERYTINETGRKLLEGSPHVDG